ncbi:Cellulose synthase 1 [Planctomycetes bacterium Pan216]|uniref:cellulose synthase (UDP-forming) n=1 Tax=Kolteria novifilia TaxID=2527975 RepID=A0A518B3T5_9BACT|nr:Cellulose synthase 1 [Planctomycetes bacterium Pan216]
MRVYLRQLVMILSAVISASYLIYRIAFTFNLETPYSIFASWLLWIAEFHCCLLLWLYFHQVWFLKQPPPFEPPPEGWTVDVFVPTYNEDTRLLRTTLIACKRMRYPHRTYVLDDGRREEVAELARELGVEYMTRPDNNHAKAGNLNHALSKTDGEYVVILDADHVPQATFLERLLGYFRDPKLGFVQSPHVFYNIESFQANTDLNKGKYWDDSELFFHVIQLGKNFWNAVVFAGSAAIFRRKALEDAGFIATETITEDLHTAIRIVSRGWSSLYVNERLVAGLAAEDITTFNSQRLRWGEGNLSILAYDNPLTIRGLKLGQRLSYFSSIFGWTIGLPSFLLYITPILVLFTDISPVEHFTWTLLAMIVTYLVSTSLALRVVSGRYGSIIEIERTNMANFYTQLRAIFRAIFGRRRQKFVVTKKRGRQSKSIWPMVSAQLALMVLAISSLVWAGFRLLYGLTPDAIAESVAGGLVVFHLLLDLRFLRKAYRKENRRYSYRHHAVFPVSYRFRDEEGNDVHGYGVTADLNEGGSRLVSYQTLPIHAVGEVTINGAGKSVTCRAEVRHKVPGVGEKANCYRYGVQFLDVTTEQADELSLMAIEYAVPATYQKFDQHRTPFQRVRDWMTRSWKRQSKRYPLRLPLLVQNGNPDVLHPTITKDISNEACRTEVAHSVAQNSSLRYHFPTPVGDISGKAQVIRVSGVTSPTNDLCDVVLRFEEFEKDGRATLARMLLPAQREPMLEALTPSSPPPQETTFRPIILSLALLAIAIPLEYGLFRFANRDGIFLREAIAEKRLPKNEEGELDSVYRSMLSSPTASIDELLLLEQVLQESGDKTKSLRIAHEICERVPDDFERRLFLASQLENVNQAAAASAQYHWLVDHLDESGISSKQRYSVLLSAARHAVNRGQLVLGTRLFKRLAELPVEMSPEVRREYAGVLMQSHQYQQAADLFRNETLTLDDREKLATIYTEAGRYNAAADQYEAILKADPDNLDVRKKMIDVLMWDGKYAEAGQRLRELLSRDPDNRSLRTRLAELQLWSKEYSRALTEYITLLERDFNDERLWSGFVDAAASAERLSPGTEVLAVKLADQMLNDPKVTATELARLAWVLQRLKLKPLSAKLCERALQVDPNDRDLRLQYANLLHDIGDFKAADEQYSILLKTSSTESPRPLDGTKIMKTTSSPRRSVTRSIGWSSALTTGYDK